MADETPYTFDAQSVKRINKVVNYVEKLSVISQPRFDDRSYVPPTGWWAKITDTDTKGKYSWKQQDPQVGGMVDMTDGLWGSGLYSDTEGFAVEALWQSTQVVLSSVVWMMPSVAYLHYEFAYNPSMIYVQLSADMKGGSPAKASVSIGGTGTVTVNNTFTTGYVSGTKVWAGYSAGQWYAIGVDCAVATETT